MCGRVVSTQRARPHSLNWSRARLGNAEGFADGFNEGFANSFADGVARIVQNIDYWAEAPRWPPENIERQTATWVRYLSGPRQD